VVLSACGRIGFDSSSGGPGDGAALCQARDVDIGHHSGCLVDTLGDVYCWGHNTNGQVLPPLGQKRLGLPDEGPPLVEFVPTPGKVALRAPTTKVAVGKEFSCALLEDSTVWCWGAGGFGQLGDGLMAARSEPVQVALGGVAVDDLDAGAHTACARVTADHSLLCWGGSQAGQLGQATDSPVPIAVPPSAGVANLDLGHRHNCATMEDGRLVCWGRGDQGQVGTSLGGPGLFTITGIGAVSNAAATGRTSCAVEADGDVMCFGSDTGGKLGDDGATASTPTPLRIPLSLDAVEVQIGIKAACARHANGTVTCWGEDLKGDGTFERTKTPRATLLANASKIVMSYSTTCAIEAGIVVCWGPNENGQLGRGTRSIAPTPVAVDLGTLAPIQIGAGDSHVCARDATQVVCWGDNASNQIGDNSNTRRVSPTPIAHGLASLDGMAVGAFATCVWSGQTMKCWGSGSDGIQTLTVPGTTQTALSLGHSHGCGVVDGGVFCRGETRRRSATADDHPITGRGDPARHGDLIGAGRDHTCDPNSSVLGRRQHDRRQHAQPARDSNPGHDPRYAVRDRGRRSSACDDHDRRRTAGARTTRRIGVGNYDISSPVRPLAAPATISDDRASYAQLMNGDVQCWGNGRLGQLGDGMTVDSSLPVLVSGLAGATSVAPGGKGGCAIASGGLVCWGESVMLGDGDDSAARPLPVAFTTCP
jgi:alpha-tubulin suppressor-like RCC1 family protein